MVFDLLRVHKVDLQTFHDWSSPKQFRICIQNKSRFSTTTIFCRSTCFLCSSKNTCAEIDHKLKTQISDSKTMTARKKGKRPLYEKESDQSCHKRLIKVRSTCKKAVEIPDQIWNSEEKLQSFFYPHTDVCRSVCVFYSYTFI